ncbi:MAG: exodeoxyribonuclease VII large subunit [Chthoniobacterales bacterium]
MDSHHQLSFDMGPLKPAALPFEKKRTRTHKIPKKSESLPEALEITPSRQVLSVSEVTRRVTLLLEKGIGEVWIEGEISNYRRQSSGHHYFTLKDAESQIACVLFARSAAMALAGCSFRNLDTTKSPPSSEPEGSEFYKERQGNTVQECLADGLSVELCGSVTVYQPRGQYQVIVRLVQAKGQGMLQAKFEALKQRLSSEGLFDQARKRSLPRFPQRIGVVTSSTGAALADFLNVLHRRHPGLRVVINPVRVQGRGAAQEIARAISEFSDAESPIGSVDVIVVTRGGGSLEDLWEFNEEVLARAIVASSIPVVSAVGHEIDFTICDFAADVRVPTPSAAAELLAADAVALQEKIFSLVMKITRELMARHTLAMKRLDYLKKSVLFREPERLFSQMWQSIDRLEEVLVIHVRRRCEKFHTSIMMATSSLRGSHPKHLLFQARERQTALRYQLDRQLLHRKDLLMATLERLRSSLAALSPQATLARGFTITRNGAGAVLTSAKQVSKGSLLRTEFRDGVIDSVETRL